MHLGIADERLHLIEIPMVKTNEQLYEYACHEGNYGTHGILAGARAGEKAR